jgi:hypothetical protein
MCLGAHQSFLFGEIREHFMEERIFDLGCEEQAKCLLCRNGGRGPAQLS